MKNHCLRVFGVPLDETLDGDEDANKFSMETLPRIAEVFLNRIDGVSLSKKGHDHKVNELKQLFQDYDFVSMPKDMQLALVCYGRFITDCSYELSDKQRWHKLRFCMENGTTWRGPKFPERVSGHVKRYLLWDMGYIL